MEHKKNSFLFIILFGLILFANSFTISNAEPKSTLNFSKDTYKVPISAQAEKKWTVMVYLDGDNNLEEAAINDLNEMEMIGSSSEVDIVVQFDRINGYDDSNYDWDETKRYHVEKDTSQSDIGAAVANIGEVNMGSGSTLEEFIIWSQTTYPAENYALILWDHGSGPMWGPYLGGICWDDSNSNDFLTQEEIISAISGKNIDLLGMDACLMGSTEVIYELNEHVDVFVASEENEPGDGWAYDLFLQELVLDPDMTAEELGEIIVQEYYDFYLPYVPHGWEVTQSAIKTNQMVSVEQSLSNLANALIDQISGFRSSIEDIRDSLHNYGDYPYVDLYAFLIELESEGILTTEIAIVKSNLEEAIISSQFTGSLSDSHGLTIYFPETAEDFSNIYTTSAFGQVSSWDEFLLAYYSAPKGDDQFEDNDLPTSAKYIHFKEYIGLICNDTDYYQLNVSSGDKLSVHLDYSHVADIADLNLYLFAENGSIIANSSTETNYESVYWTADVNQTVSVKINNTFGEGLMVLYAISAYIPIDDDYFDLGGGNDDYSTATDISLDLDDNNNANYTNLVCINPDFYNFSVNGKDAYATVFLEYVAIEGVLGLEIVQYDLVNYTQIQSINTPDNNALATFSAQYSPSLAYYIIVSNYENNTNYNITVTLDYDLDDVFDNETEDNDLISLSIDIPRINQIYTDLVCIDNDFYNISLVENEWLNVSLYFQHSNGDLDLYLYGPNTNWSSSEQFISSSYYWEDNEMITYLCPENGTYSIRVYPREINLDYNMSITVNETGITNDPYDGSNEHWDQHESFPNINLNAIYPDLTAWDNDWYSVNLIAGEEIVISLIYEVIKGTLVISLYDSSGDKILSSYNHLYYMSDKPDIYYIKIIPFQRLPEYILTVAKAPSLDIDFSASLTSSLVVDFTELVDLTYLVDYFIWEFGDGTYYLGNDANLTHVYSEPGHYPVSLTLWTKYGKGVKYTEYVDVFSTPEDGFLIYLNGTNPLSNATFDIYWDPLVNAQNLSIYYSVSNTVPIEDWPLLQADSSGNVISITLTLQQGGTYYFVVKYSNLFGTAVSEILLVEIQLDNDSDNAGGTGNTGGILDFIPGYNNLLLIGICSVVGVYLYQKKKK